MKLLQEMVVCDFELLEEEVGGKKHLFIKGPFLVSEKLNRNNRIYRKHIMESEVNRYTKEYIDTNRAMGELGHPPSPAINLDRVSHLITELRNDGNIWIGKAKILDTPMGNIAKGIMEGGAQLGISSRGTGSLKTINGANEVQDDFRLATAGDIVADPSAPGAFVQSLREEKEWIFENGIWREQDLMQAKEKLMNASRKDIEKVSLIIFEELLRKF